MFAALWHWLRTRTRDAILAGVADAVAALDGTGEDGTDTALAGLTARFQAIPRPDAADDTAGTRKRK